MLGAIIGDIAGSRFELSNYREKDFEIFHRDSFYTDDSVMTIAVCDALLRSAPDFGTKELEANAVRSMREIGRAYPDCGYGAGFSRWLFSKDPKPYGSYGNGAAMRVSGCAYVAGALEETLRLSDAVTCVTHDHPEGMKGARATAAAIYLARTGAGKKQIIGHIRENYYGYDFTGTFTVGSVRPAYGFGEACQNTVPQALEAFFESENFEDAIRTAVSLGGDSDTLAAITGSIAEAYYGIPADMRERALGYFDRDRDRKLLDAVRAFEEKYPPKVTPECGNSEA